MIRAIGFLGKVGGFGVTLMVFAGCQNYRDQLARGQGYYEQNQYEAALAVWRNLEPDQSSLSHPEVVRYAYLRGMTDYRLGYKADARYWLGLSKAGLNRAQAADGEPVALQPDEAERLDETLTELNNEVYGLLGSESEEEAEALGEKCEWTSDCDSGFACQDGMCLQAEGPASEAAGPVGVSAPVTKGRQATPKSETAEPATSAPAP